MSENSIVSVSKDAFDSLPSLQHLDLSNNLIERLDPEVFSSNDRLREINLSRNKIRTLDAEIFQSLPLLKRFAVKGNPLEVCEVKTRAALLDLKNREVETGRKVGGCVWYYYYGSADENLVERAKEVRRLFFLLLCFSLFAVMLYWSDLCKFNVAQGVWRKSVVYCGKSPHVV